MRNDTTIEEYRQLLAGDDRTEQTVKEYCKYIARAIEWCHLQGTTLDLATEAELARYGATLPDSKDVRAMTRTALRAARQAVGRDETAVDAIELDPAPPPAPAAPDPDVDEAEAIADVPVPPERPDGPPEDLDAEGFAGYLIAQGLADYTVRNYKCLYQRWADWAAGQGLDPHVFAPTHLRQWAAVLPQTRSMLAQARATVLHLAVVCGWDVEAVRNCVLVPPRPVAKSRALDLDRIRVLRQAAEDVGGQAGLAVLVGLYTAARRGEIAGMRWDGVDWDRDRITFWRPKTKDWHTVPLHARLRAHLEQRHIEGEVWLFPGRHGGHVTGAKVWEWVTEVSSTTGLRVTPHVLRHCAITQINDLTRDLRAAQEIAGHRSPRETARYSRVSDARAAEAIAALDYD